MQYIPKKSLAVVVPEPGQPVSNILEEPYIPLMDDISPSAIQLISSLDAELLSHVTVHALLLYPDTANEWQPVWITSAGSSDVQRILPGFQRDFEQNRYDFQGQTIEKMFIADRILYTFSAGEWTAFSESSIALEDMIRAGNHSDRRLDPADFNTSAEFIVNLGNAGRFARQLAQVTSHPQLYGLFTGAGTLPLQTSSGPGEGEWRMDGTARLGQNTSDFLNIFQTEPSSFMLDRYIPVNASSFFLFRASPEESQADTLSAVSDLDEFLKSNENITQQLTRPLGEETAFVTFTQSGPSSDSEYLFLRALEDSSALTSVLDQLHSRQLIPNKSGNTYSINSQIAGKLLGSDLFPSADFYLTVYDGAIALAMRRGLAESIGGDAARRRVMYYNDGYRAIADANPASLTTFFYARAHAFETYIQPWLYPQNYVSPLLSPFDQIVITTSFHSSNNTLDVSLQNLAHNETEQPFTEHWLFPLQGAELTGVPITADITGTNRKEVVFSTTNGSVYTLASDGTTVLHVSTGDDTPVGSPVLYDWYGNNSQIIMQAAGNKIYAWNSNGELLPSFPVVMREQITTPLIVEDVTSNGMGEMVVATADRNLHILNNRGQALRGWPQNTNSAIRHKPAIARVNNTQSIIAFAENTLHSWSVNGQLNAGYPQFFPVQINGSPATAGNHIFGSGMDGRLYAAGSTPVFTDSLSTTISNNPLVLASVPVANTNLVTSPFYLEDVQLRDATGLIRGDAIALQASSGSIFLHKTDGSPVSVFSMGQPGSPAFAPLIADIDSDGRNDLIALADFGRLYAWDILSGERLIDLPTAGMSHPLIEDFLNNGSKEIIAQTRDGLICWTINFTRKEAAD